VLTLAAVAVALAVTAGMASMVALVGAGDDFGPSVRDFAAFRAALARTGSPDARR
jgi:hypothetical protein